MEKSGSWDLGQNAVGQSDCRIFKLTMSPEHKMKKSDFLHADTDYWKLKVSWKIVGGHGQRWVWPLWSEDTKIGCISKKNGINWFLCVDKNSGKPKVTLIIFGCWW